MHTAAAPLRAFAICPRCCELYPASRGCPQCDGAVAEPSFSVARSAKTENVLETAFESFTPPAARGLAWARPWIAAASVLAVVGGMLALMFLVQS